MKSETQEKREQEAGARFAEWLELQRGRLDPWTISGWDFATSVYPLFAEELKGSRGGTPQYVGPLAEHVRKQLTIRNRIAEEQDLHSVIRLEWARNLDPASGETRAKEAARSGYRSTLRHLCVIADHVSKALFRKAGGGRERQLEPKVERSGDEGDRRGTTEGLRRYSFEDQYLIQHQKILETPRDVLSKQVGRKRP